MKITNSATFWLWLPVLLGLLLLASCNEGSLAEQTDKNIAGSEAPEIVLSAISPTTPADLENIEIAAERGEGGFDYTILAGEGYQGTDQLFLAASFDGENYHPYGVEIGDTSADSIGLASEAGPGIVHAGIVNTPKAQGPAVEPGDAILGFKLVQGASDKSARTVAQTNSARANNLELDQDVEDNWVLTWDYTNPGDNDQDGEVGIKDLQPIAANYLKRVSNSWDDPLRHLDADENSEINAGDIVPMAMNFSAEIWAYQIEMSEDGESDFIVVGQLVLGDQQPSPGETVRFSYTFSAQYVENAWYPRCANRPARQHR